MQGQIPPSARPASEQEPLENDFVQMLYIFSTLNLKIDHESSCQGLIPPSRLSHRFKTSSKQGYKCPKKLLNCMENQVKTQTRMSIWPKLLRPERPAKSPRGIHVAPVAGSIGSGKYVSSQG